MILSNAAFNWASLRSGLTLPDFVASLTPEKEEEILKQYNEWRRARGLPEDKPLAPKPPARVAGEAASPQQAVPVAQAAPEQDALSEMVSQIADQVKREALEEAELIKEALREIDVEPAPRRPEEAPEAAAPRAKAPAQTAALPEDDNARPPLAVVEKPVTAEGPTAGAQPLSLSDRLSAMARALPKEPDPALYSRILEQLGESVEAVSAAIDAVRREYTAKHRSTAGLRKFLDWLK